jgi:hypothetical protein
MTTGFVFTESGRIWSVPLSMASGRPDGAARILTFGAGRYTHPTASRDGQIVFAMPLTERVIERAPLSDAGALRPPVRLYADTSVPRRASQASDGAIVFERGTGQRREILLKAAQGGELRTLQQLDTEWPVHASISPDGARVGYTVADQQHLAATVWGTGYVFESTGGVARRLCEHCGVYGFLSDGRRAIITNADSAIQFVDVLTGSKQDIIARAPGQLDRPSVSPDGRWIAFRQTRGSSLKVFLAAVDPAHPSARDTWTEVDEPTVTGRPAGWSPDSTVAYLLLDTDGSRCLWGQRIDSARMRVVGKPFPVRHFHAYANAGLSTSLGNAINADGFLYEGQSQTGSLWRLLPASPASR